LITIFPNYFESELFFIKMDLLRKMFLSLGHEKNDIHSKLVNNPFNLWQTLVYYYRIVNAVKPPILFFPLKAGFEIDNYHLFIFILRLRSFHLKKNYPANSGLLRNIYNAYLTPMLCKWNLYTEPILKAVWVTDSHWRASTLYLLMWSASEGNINRAIFGNLASKKNRKLAA